MDNPVVSPFPGCAFPGASLLHRADVESIAMPELRPGAQIAAQAGGQVVEHGNLGPGAQQGLDHMGADVTGSADDENVHGIPPMDFGEKIVSGRRAGNRMRGLWAAAAVSSLPAS